MGGLMRLESASQTGFVLYFSVFAYLPTRESWQVCKTWQSRIEAVKNTAKPVEAIGRPLLPAGKAEAAMPNQHCERLRTTS